MYELRGINEVFNGTGIVFFSFHRENQSSAPKMIKGFSADLHNNGTRTKSLEYKLSDEHKFTDAEAIEKAVGRVETVPWGPRVIDIDIMMIGDMIIDTPHLVVPQKRLEHRRFALTPLAEIAPQAMHPLLKCTVEQLLATCDDTTWVKKWKP